MLCFLLGRKMFDGATLMPNDLNRVMEAVGLARGQCAMVRNSEIEPEPEPEPEPSVDGAETSPKARWVVGLLERYAETVALFSAAAPEHFAHPEVM